jgi:hypothetical protein
MHVWPELLRTSLVRMHLPPEEIHPPPMVFIVSMDRIHYLRELLNLIPGWDSCVHG